MGIRIERIDINRGGPLRNDFSFEPEELNLIYGYNETGKTYIVEAIIELLFRTGKNTPWIINRTRAQEPTIRKWNPRGKILVSGLENDTTVFTSGSRKLEDFGSSDENIPDDLSRLMVVRGGDTRLSRERDGVGDRILRTYLSGKGILDDIEKNISQETVKKAVIEGGIIEAKQTGLIDDRLKIQKEIEFLDSLQQKVDENASLSTVNSLEKTKKDIEEQLKKLENAKRFKAFSLNSELKKLELEKNTLPSGNELEKLGTDISLYRVKLSNLKDIEEKLKDIADPEDNYEWIKAAREEYLSHPEVPLKKLFSDRIILSLLVLFILLTAAAGFFSRPLTLISAAGALICLILLSRIRPEPVSAPAEMRRTGIEKEFHRRFSRELTDPAVLQVEYQKMEKKHFHLESLRESFRQMNHDIRMIETEIFSGIHAFSGENVNADLWDEKIESVRKAKRDIEETVISIKGVLASLNVASDSYLTEAPHEEWDQKMYLMLKDELESVTVDLDREKRNIESLKTDVSRATGLNSLDIRQLLTALKSRRETAGNRYREITAKILADNTVYRAVCEFRSKENTRLEEALESEEITSPLYRITGRYTGLKMDDEGYLILRTPDEESYPLERLSTGAAEQIYVALRTGFAERSIGEPAFLVLDDAFQHSDWQRRKNLVDHTVELARSGWQVFYFTMDEHLRKLFDESGKGLSKIAYRCVTLN